MRLLAIGSTIFVGGCACAAASHPAAAPATAPASAPAPTPAPPAAPTTHTIALPGATADGVFMDYLAADPAHHRIWVPAGNTGSVDVIDTTNEQVTRIDGFPTAEMERRGQKRTVGPSSATVGDGVAYVGNRGDSKVCAIDEATLKLQGCVALASMPDGLAYVAATKEVWVTTPRDNSITILDASTPAAPKLVTTIKLEGQPEGYVVDDARGVFYTNFEDKDKTVTLDLAKRAVTRTWEPHCGDDGPKGLALDRAHDLLIVACPDHVELLDAEHDGKLLWQVYTGDGIDDISYQEASHTLYAAAAEAARLTIARVDPEAGTFLPLAIVPTHERARNAVATAEGVAFVTDSKEGAILVVDARSLR